MSKKYFLPLYRALWEHRNEPVTTGLLASASDLDPPEINALNEFDRYFTRREKLTLVQKRHVIEKLDKHEPGWCNGLWWEDIARDYGVDRAVAIMWAADGYTPEFKIGDEFQIKGTGSRHEVTAIEVSGQQVIYRFKVDVGSGFCAEEHALRVGRPYQTVAKKGGEVEITGDLDHHETLQFVCDSLRSGEFYAKAWDSECDVWDLLDPGDFDGEGELGYAKLRLIPAPEKGTKMYDPVECAHVVYLGEGMWVDEDDYRAQPRMGGSSFAQYLSNRYTCVRRDGAVEFRGDLDNDDARKDILSRLTGSTNLLTWEEEHEDWCPADANVNLMDHDLVRIEQNPPVGTRRWFCGAEHVFTDQGWVWTEEQRTREILRQRKREEGFIGQEARANVDQFYHFGSVPREDAKQALFAEHYGRPAKVEDKDYGKSYDNAVRAVFGDPGSRAASRYREWEQRTLYQMKFEPMLRALEQLFQASVRVGPCPVAVGLALVRVQRCLFRKNPPPIKATLEQAEEAIGKLADERLTREERWDAVAEHLKPQYNITRTYDEVLLDLTRREMAKLDAPEEEHDEGSPLRGLDEWLKKPLGTVGER